MPAMEGEMRTKKLGVLLAVLLCGVACGKEEPPQTADDVEPEPPPPPPPPPKPEPPKPLVGEDLGKRYIECWDAFSAGNWDKLGECYAEDAVATWPDSGQPELKGTEAIIEGAKGFKDAFADGKGVPQLVLVNDRNVTSITWITGTQSGALKVASGEIPPTSKKIGEYVFHSVTFNAANEVTQEVMVEDAGSLMFQLGLSPGPGRAAREAGFEGAPIVVVASGDPSEEANVTAVKLSAQQFAKEDVKGMSALLADDVFESDQSSVKDVKGKKAVIAGTKLFLGAMGKITYDCPVVWAAGAYVVSECKFNAVHDGNLGRLKKTGKPVALTVAEVNKLDGGKFKETWRFFNSAAFAMQLGLIPTPSASTDKPKGAEKPK
jgi:ketosteroid isomerase-like protein